MWNAGKFGVLGLALLQAMGTWSQVAARGLLVEFNQDLVTDWRALLNTDSLLANLNEHVQMRQADGNATIDIVGDLRPDEVPEVFNTSSVLLANTKTNHWNDVERQLVADDNYTPQQNPLPPSPSTTACSDASAVPSGPNVQVFVLVSSCINNAGWDLIDGWISNLQAQDARYFQGGAASNIEFVKRVVDDGCDPCAKGRNPIDFNSSQKPIAVISIMVYSKGFEAINAYLSAKNIPTLIGFVVQEPPKCQTNIPGYTVIPPMGPNGFLNAFDPFTVSRTIHCKNMPGGIPTSYIDNNGQRQCFCSCPAGYELKSGSCRPIQEPSCQCSWGKVTDGFKFEVKLGDDTKYTSSLKTCSIKNLAIKGTSGLIPVPVALDNYVDHLRVNDGDLGNPLASATPQIALQKTKLSVTVSQGAAAGVLEQGDAKGTTTAYTWKDFQTASSDKIDALEFTRTGKYSLGLTAKDYNNDVATCDGCVLVIDSRRPTPNPNFQCPTCVNGVTSDLTNANLKKAQDNVNAVSAFKNNALNDPCSPNVRCDDDTLKLKKFTDYAGYGATGTCLDPAATFFAPASVKSDLVAKLTGSPFDSSKPNGISTATSDVCTRCASLGTKLKEWWTPYTCTSNSATSICDGLESSKCALEQCVSVNGNTLATASASLKPTIKAASKSCASTLNNNPSTTDAALTTKYSLDSTVHVAVDCSKFPSSGGGGGQYLLADDGTAEVCSYSSKIADLIQISTGNGNSQADSLFSAAEVDGFVSWRYNVDGGAWKTWVPMASSVVETFTKTQTPIIVEAWTKCGKVQTFTFSVVLHLNNPITVCDHFNDMWYQSTTAPLYSSPNQYCLYPKSDFAEITFDYHPNIGLAFDVDKFQMSISRVQCTLQYDGKDGVTIVDSDLFTSNPKSYQIVKQFSIDGVNIATTKSQTKVSVSCDFTYNRQLDSKKVTQTCKQNFVFVDCTGPQINKPCPLDGRCDYNKCEKANDPRPDLFQACGGNRISQAQGTGKTTLTTTDSACCNDCDTNYFTTACSPIQAFPTGVSTSFTYVKRCEAVPKAGTAMLLATAQQYASSSVPAMIAASAMVAVIALVAMQRRRTPEKKRVVQDDGYYALMN